MNNPLVSIIVITYNSSKYVLETLESAYYQTYSNIELIISDDGSIDNTVEICRTWLITHAKKFKRSKLITIEKNTGIPTNCNRGVKVANGEWIKIIAGDDILYEDCIFNNVNFINNNKHINVLHSKCSLIDNSSTKIEDSNFFGNLNVDEVFNNLNAKDQFLYLFKINPIIAPTIFINKSTIVKNGYFIEKLKLWEDRPMWLKLTHNGVKIFYMNVVTVKYRKHPDSIQIQKKIFEMYERYYIDKQKYILNEYSKYFTTREKMYKKYSLNSMILINYVYQITSSMFITRVFNFILITLPSKLVSYKFHEISFN